MKCKECMKEGKVSRITLGPLTLTTVSSNRAYYDEEGKYREAEYPSSVYQEYTCSNGHSWEEKKIEL